MANAPSSLLPLSQYFIPLFMLLMLFIRHACHAAVQYTDSPFQRHKPGQKPQNLPPEVTLKIHGLLEQSLEHFRMSISPNDIYDEEEHFFPEFRKNLPCGLEFQAHMFLDEAMVKINGWEVEKILQTVVFFIIDKNKPNFDKGFYRGKENRVKVTIHVL